MVEQRSITKELVLLFEEHEKELIDLWMTKMKQLKLIKGLSDDEREQEFRNIYRASLSAFKTGDYSEVENYRELYKQDSKARRAARHTGRRDSLKFPEAS